MNTSRFFSMAIKTLLVITIWFGLLSARAWNFTPSTGQVALLAPDQPHPPTLPNGDGAAGPPGTQLPTIASYWLAPSNLLPDLRTLPPSDLEIEHLSDGDRHLRLSNTIWNSGPGPLELSGDTNAATSRTVVHQRIYTTDGQPYLHPVGEFIWHPTHDHWHFEEFTVYELWSIDPTGKRQKLLSSSDKLSYCVIDTDVVSPQTGGFSSNRRYGGCGQKLQGLSSGWGDTYKSHLDGQSIEISNVRDGVYTLLSRTNPTGMLVEASLDNNSAEMYIKIQGGNVVVVPAAELSELFCLPSGRC